MGLRNHSAEAGSGNSELTPKEFAFRERWEVSRSGGKARFVLLYYVLGQGLSLALFSTIYGVSAHSPGGWLNILPSLLIFVPLMLLASVGDWALNERKYREQSERTGILMKPLHDANQNSIDGELQ